jgi:hypothetical protein
VSCCASSKKKKKKKKKRRMNHNAEQIETHPFFLMEDAVTADEVPSKVVNIDRPTRKWSVRLDE